MNAEKIKPIPKYIKERIYKLDQDRRPSQDGVLRFYSYLAKNEGELVKITVAVKSKYKKWHCKQVAVHGLRSDYCLVKDMIFHYIAGYSVGWQSEGLYKQKKWYEDNEWGEGYEKMFDPYAPIVNKEFLAKLPEFKYSASELYQGDDIIRYLRVYEEHPGVEMLLKLGLEELTHSKTIICKCEKDKLFKKWIYRNAETIRKSKYYISSLILAYKSNMSIADAYAIEYIKKSLMNKEFAAIRQVIKKNYKAFEEYVKTNKITYYQYRDYVDVCLKLGLDMTLPKNIFPHEFRKWHDIRIDQYATKKALERAEKEKELTDKFSAVAEKYLALQKQGKDDYIIIIAKSPVELVKEGAFLHHCVGRMNYDQKMAREETLIFFIRKKSEPDTPLATLEYSLSKKAVLQCYGNHDSKPEAAIEEFVYHKWLPYANRKLKRIAA